MALKLIKTLGDIKTFGVKIYRDSEWNEYRNCYYYNGKHRKQADGFTDDKNDAIGTAEFEIKRNAEKSKIMKKPKSAKKPKVVKSAVAILKEIEKKRIAKNPVKKAKTKKVTENKKYVFAYGLKSKSRTLASFPTLEAAKEMAQYYADKHKTSVEIFKY